MEEQLKYKELRQKFEPDLEPRELQFQTEEALQQLNADITATTRELLKSKSELGEAIASYPFDPPLIVEAENEIKALESGLKRLEEFKLKLF